MRAGILSIGTELTRGEIENTNVTWLCQRLTELGLEVVLCESVADTASEIQDALKRLSSKADVVVSTGGLGPTTDDITAQCVAALLAEPLQRHAPSIERIRERLARSGRELSESNCKQADMPQSATVLDNHFGTAPGFRVTIEGCECNFLPGVPYEMKSMFEQHISPELTGRVGLHIHQVRIRTFGAPEAQVNDMLEGIEREFDVVLAYRAKFPTIEVKPLATRDDPGQARAAAQAAAAEVKRRLGSLVFAEGNREFPEVVADSLRTRGWTLGLAESCTGGLVAKLITQYPASDYFRGAIVCYDNGIKTKLLGVEPAALDNEGAVSEEVVRQMAQGARRTLGCDVALALSGIAGPSGGTEEKPVGLVHYAVATPEKVEARHRVFAGERERIQLRAAYAGLDLIRELCQK